MAVMTQSRTTAANKVLNKQNIGAANIRENRGVPEHFKAADLPDETLNDFSDAPFEFEETAELVQEDVQRLYYHAGTANRFSEKYLKYMIQLESFIKQAGTYCLTKAVLEQKGFSFPKLEDLTILKLVRMTSFHIRKCHAAIDGLYRDNNKLGSVYLQWELRWISLSERLKATGLKIQKIQEGKLKADDLIDRETPFRNKPRTNECSTGLPSKLLLNPHALPLDRSMAREMLRNEALEQKELDRQRREEEKWERAAMNLPFAAKPFPPASKREILEALFASREKAAARQETCDSGGGCSAHRRMQNEPSPSVTGGASQQPEGITEAEARKHLMDKAMREGDQAALLTIPMEDSDTFHARWVRYVEEAEAENRRRTGREGPSDATRKKLREKRKKRR